MIPFVDIAALGHSPVPAVIIAGIFVGAALSTATRRTRHRKDPERAKTRKWIIACLWLSVAIVFGLLAVFVPGPAHILDLRLGWLAGIATAVSFLALRFRKAAGLPVVVLLAALVVVTALFLQSIRAFTGETEIATVRAIAVTADSMRLEVAPHGEPPVLLTMDGVYFAPVVKEVIPKDLLVFLGAKTFYRFEGMNSFNDDLTQVKTAYRFPRPLGVSERLWAFFERNEQRIPGVEAVQVGMEAKRPRAPRLEDAQPKEFSRYSIMLRNDGRVAVVPKP